jgi:ABC-2 type transport system ATP-binding protein
MCTHVGVMSAGALVAQGSLEALRRAGQAHLRLLTPDVAAARGQLARLGVVPDDVLGPPDGDGAALLTAPLPEHAPAPETIVAELVGAGVRVRGFAVAEASLEERFVALTGEGFDVAQ